MINSQPSRLSRRMVSRAVPITAFALAVFALIGVQSFTPFFAGASSGTRTTGQVARQCSNSDLRATISTNRRSYEPGALVRMTFTVRNISTLQCAIAVGPSSPSFTVNNSSGVTVWNNCYRDDQPGMCAEYLMMRSLRPNAAYVQSETWNQGSGSSNTRAPLGIYTLSVQFSEVKNLRPVRFRLAAASSPRVINATEVNSGQSYTMHVGDSLVVTLSGPSNYTWSEPVSTNQASLQRTQVFSGATASASFIAEAAGKSQVTAVDNPNCYPQCLPPSRLFELGITVIP